MSRWVRSIERILVEDALKHIHQGEVAGYPPTIQSIAGALEVTPDRAADLLAKMTAHNLVELEGDRFRLTSQGQEYALQIIRAHRLWERYLADETGFPAAEWHDRAHRQEHLLSPGQTDALAAQLGHPTHDPHGDPIPTAQGELPRQQGQPLTTLAVGQAARIIHLEDEPEAIGAQLIAEGLYPGMEVRLKELSAQQVCFCSRGREYVLAPIVAANIAVLPLPKQPAVEARPTLRLSDLELGQQGQVIDISPVCRGQERRRFMDLGILPGTVIKAEMSSPSGNPIAYYIRGALMALRREQAHLINVQLVEEVNR